MENSEKSDAAPLIVRVGPEDNVCVAARTIEPGREISLEGRPITVSQRIPAGHKLAVVAIPSGAKVLKYGLPIGSATCDIGPGDYVHTHNLKSDYLPTYTLDGSSPFPSE